MTSKEYYDDQLAVTRTDTFAWDLRGRMVEAEVDGVVTEYGYDHAGVRVWQTTGTDTTVYLIDPQNLTGYAKSIEDRVNSVLSKSYVIGLTVETQADAQGTVHLIKDGHGSTRLLTNASGATVAGSAYDYRAYGEAVGFTKGSARTTWLFGGDGVYDPAVGLTNHLIRWREGNRFVSQDPTIFGAGNLHDANLYRYASGSPLMYTDPSGRISLGGTLTAIGVIGAIGGSVGGIFASIQAEPGERWEAFFHGYLRGYIAGATTTALLLYAPVLGLPLAAAFGNATSSVLGDLFQVAISDDDSTTKEMLINASIHGLLGLTLGAVVGRFTPNGATVRQAVESYRQSQARAIAQRLPPTYPFATAGQEAKALGVSLAQVETLRQITREYSVKLTAILIGDTTLSNLTGYIAVKAVRFVEAIGEIVREGKDRVE